MTDRPLGPANPRQLRPNNGRHPRERVARAALGGLQLHRALDPLRLRLVVEIGLRGSISRAAEACSIGQPAASMHLRALEAAMGQRLVERDGRASRLTDAGEVVAREAAHALATLSRLERELDDLAAGRRVLRIAASSSVGDDVLTEAISAFVKRFPQAGVEVRAGTSRDVTAQVTSGDVQLGIAAGLAAADGAPRLPLYSDELVGIAAPGAFEPGSSGTTLEMLMQHPVVVLPSGSYSRDVVESTLASVGLRASRTMVLHSLEAVKRAVRRGLGVAFVPARAVCEELGRQELMSFRVESMNAMHVVLFLVGPHHRGATAPEEAFIEVLLEAVARTTDELEDSDLVPTASLPIG